MKTTRKLAILVGVLLSAQSSLQGSYRESRLDQLLNANIEQYKRIQYKAARRKNANTVLLQEESKNPTVTTSSSSRKKSQPQLNSKVSKDLKNSILTLLSNLNNKTRSKSESSCNSDLLLHFDFEDDRGIPSPAGTYASTEDAKKLKMMQYAHEQLALPVQVIYKKRQQKRHNLNNEDLFIHFDFEDDRSVHSPAGTYATKEHNQKLKMAEYVQEQLQLPTKVYKR